jgi:phage shock protein E
MNFLNKLFGNQGVEGLEKALHEGATLVDVRGPGEFASGSVEGAINFPLDTLFQHLEELKGKENIVVFCRSGARSAQAKSFLEQQGHKNVINGGPWQDVAAVLEKISNQ